MLSGRPCSGCQEGAGIQFFLSAWLIQTPFQDALINRYKSAFSWKDRYGEEKRHQCEFSADDGEGALSTVTCIETWKLHRPLCPCDAQTHHFPRVTMSHTFLWDLIKQGKKTTKKQNNKSSFFLRWILLFISSMVLALCVPISFL